MPNSMRRGPDDPERIDIASPINVRYWCRELNVTPVQLRAAVEKIGPAVDDVCVELGLPCPRTKATSDAGR
jgi:hypothetical protein